MRLTELVEAIDFLHNAGWTVEPPKKAGTKTIGASKRVGRKPKNGRRKRGCPGQDSSTAA